MISRPPSASREVVMIGPDLTVQGGITTVVKNLLAVSNGNSWRLIHIGCYCRGSKLKKLLIGSRSLLAFTTRVFKQRPRLVHIHFASYAGFWRESVFLLVARALRVPVILHSNAASFHVFFQNLPNALRTLVVYLLNRAQALIVVSTQWGEFFQHIGVAVPIHIIPNPVAVSDAGTRGQRDLRVLTLGRLGKRKGTYDLLQAIPAILDVQPAAEFWLCGDGEVETVRKVLEDKPWSSRVVVKTWIDSAEREELLRHCGIFVLPSYEEGLPLAILEAMASGVPVVSTRVGGIPDAVDDGRTGYLINAGDIPELARRIGELLNNEPLRLQMGKAARDRAENTFESNLVMRRIEHLYEEVSTA